MSNSKENHHSEDSCIFKELSESLKTAKMSVSPSGNFSIANLLKTESGSVKSDKKPAEMLERTQKLLFPTV